MGYWLWIMIIIILKKSGNVPLLRIWHPISGTSKFCNHGLLQLIWFLRMCKTDLPVVRAIWSGVIPREVLRQYNLTRTNIWMPGAASTWNERCDHERLEWVSTIYFTPRLLYCNMLSMPSLWVMEIIPLPCTEWSYCFPTQTVIYDYLV